MPRNPTRSSRHSSSSPKGVLLPLLTGGIALYVVCLGLFALFHYESGTRPAAGRVMHEFHAFLGVGPAQARAETPVAKPTPPRTHKATPPRAPTPPPAPIERSPLDKVAQTLRRIERDAPLLKQRARDASFEPARIEVLSDLCEARDTLNEILDDRPSHDRANRLWDRLQMLLAAVRKL